MTAIFGGCFVVLFVLVLVGAFRRGYVVDGTPEITSHDLHGAQTGKLYVIVHGFGGPKHEAEIAAALAPYGRAIGVHYPHGASSEDPLKVASGLAQEIERNVRDLDQEIVLIGESMGALIVRRAFLDARSRPWAKRVKRIVLLAGMNRGWDITGHKPADMGFQQWAAMYLGSWLGRIADLGRLAMAMESGAPFVANLRLDWMRQLRDPELAALEVVQLRGDIDDIVSDEDNKDLGAIASANFAWLRVRGTGHGDIAFFSDRGDEKLEPIGEYRKKKFLVAATEPFAEVVRQSEKDPFTPDPDVTHIVFVLHGIRDLGEWAAAFEQDLQKQFAQVSAPNKNKLAVASVRYGYFGMGPFLFLAKRQNFVRWLMDEYTEILARYPNATEIHFAGHSNGTYLLASALDRYESLRIDRIAFGGSVVRTDYDWSKVIGRKQVQSVRNYVAADDWIVALFPRFFEPRLPHLVFANDLGSAGFNGFSKPSKHVTNVSYLTGGHGAFLARTEEISRFLLLNDATFEKAPEGEQAWLLRAGSCFGTWFVVWPLIVATLIFVGWHVVMSATEPRWPFFLGYALLLLAILWTA